MSPDAFQPSRQEEGRRVLVVRPSSLGDIVHTMALVCDVERQAPGTAVDWVAEEAFVPLVALHPGIRRVIPLAFRRWRSEPLSARTRHEFLAFRHALREERYDAILDLQEQLKGAIVARLARGPRHGFDRANVREPVATWLDDVHHAIDRHQHFIAKARAMAAAALDYRVDGPPRWKLLPGPRSAARPDGPYAIVFHATSRHDKLWPEPDWTGLLANFAQAGFTVLLPWGDDMERARSDRLARAATNAIVPPRQGLPELASLAQSAEIVVGVDTGLTHLAAAMGTPTVAIFTSTDASLAGVAAAGAHATDLGGNGRVPSLAEVVEGTGRVLRDAPPMLMRALYDVLWYLFLPWLPLRLWWRGRREPGYRARIGERFGRYSGQVPADIVWIHAVSLGETRAAAPLVARVLRELPDATVLLTHMTATGRAAGAALASERVVQAWLPYDVPFAVRRFLAHWKPRAGLLMETEVWPNLVAQSAAARIPLFLVNARLSEKSLRAYRRLARFTRPVFASLAGVAAQTEADARRLREAGAHDVAVTGNLKFDVSAGNDVRTRGHALRELLGAHRPVWVAASTREGEETLVLEAIARHPLPASTLTVIVPRHPQRFDEVAALLGSRGLPFVRRSAGVAVPGDVAFVLGDSLGELLAYYAAADAAFVGGSLVPLGGQNLIEPIAAGAPTLVGPHTFNFAEAAAQAVAAQAALRVGDADALVLRIGELLRDPAQRARMREAALAFHAAHGGATDRLWTWLASRLPT